MGLTKEQMQNQDALFFFQLLCPFCNPTRSDIKDDPSKPDYTDVSCSTYSYAIEKKGWGGDYGHAWKNVTAQDIVN